MSESVMTVERLREIIHAEARYWNGVESTSDDMESRRVMDMASIIATGALSNVLAASYGFVMSRHSDTSSLNKTNDVETSQEPAPAVFAPIN